MWCSLKIVSKNNHAKMASSHPLYMHSNRTRVCHWKLSLWLQQQDCFWALVLVFVIVHQSPHLEDGLLLTLTLDGCMRAKYSRGKHCCPSLYKHYFSWLSLLQQNHEKIIFVHLTMQYIYKKKKRRSRGQRLRQRLTILSTDWSLLFLCPLFISSEIFPRIIGIVLKC